jgi:hypothetical protein
MEHYERSYEGKCAMMNYDVRYSCLQDVVCAPNHMQHAIDCSCFKATSRNCSAALVADSKRSFCEVQHAEHAVGTCCWTFCVHLCLLLATLLCPLLTLLLLLLLLSMVILLLARLPTSKFLLMPAGPSLLPTMQLLQTLVSWRRQD